MDQTLHWDDDYSMGIKEIDEQHMELINLVNLLNQAYLNHKDKEAQDYATQKLLEYTLFHFGTEEAFFKEYSYPEMDSHMKEHSFFIKKISQFKKDYDASKNNLSQEIIAFLKGWIRHHILVIDSRYSILFRENGILLDKNV